MIKLVEKYKLLNPKKHADQEIAQVAEEQMKSIYSLAGEVGFCEKNYYYVAMISSK